MKTHIRLTTGLSFACLFLFISGSSLAPQTRQYEPPVPGRFPRAATPAEPAPARQTYTVNAKQFRDEGKNYGFNWNAHKKDSTSQCGIGYKTSMWYYQDRASVYALGGIVFGSRCDYTINEPATLKNGFVFKSYSGKKQVDGRADVEITSSPAPGSTSMKFTLHAWTEGGTDNNANYNFEYFVLEGPAGRDWKEALR